MGIHGLTTFIQRYHGKYKEKIYLRDCPVVIDGCNLMFFLYFEGRQGLPAPGPQNKRSSTSGSPLSKASPLKFPHLFGGDYLCYAQNVREFFQHLKHCNITPIVLFDGAYDAMKIKTAYRRFAESIKDNVRSSGNSLKGVTPGPSYSPVFMKAVFVEILQEQKITHYQTEQEADCTIAFIARKLGNCPILSSDSDFHIYVNAIILPLNSLKFKKVTPPKDKQKNSPTDESQATTASDKVWTLHSEYVSLAKLCREEFNMTDMRMLPLAAVILGNDWIRTSAFANFHTKKAGGGKVQRNSRIAYLLRWLGRQKSNGRVIAAMLATVKDSRREQMSTLVNEIISTYEGLSGEEKVLTMLISTSAGQQLEKYLAAAAEEEKNKLLLADDKIIDDLANLNLSTAVENSADLLLQLDYTQDNINHEDIGNDDNDEDIGLQDESDDDDEVDSKIDPFSEENKLALPEWYIEAHLKCLMPTYLLKLARNRMVFLSPQAEVSSLPSTHTMSTQIIQVIGGIFLGENQTITLISRKKSQLIEMKVPTIAKFEKWGPLPRISEDSEDFRKSISSDSRSLLVLETLGLDSPEIVAFITQWPVSLRIWIASILYFIRKSNSDNIDDENENGSNMDFIKKTSIPVALAILLSVIKNVVLSPSGSSKKDASDEPPKISELLNQSDPINLSNLRKFYAKYEIVVDASSRNFTRSYDITRTYNLCQFICIVFHVHQLNRLLGDPFKAPRINYNLNNWFVYNFSGEMTIDDGDFKGSESEYGNFIGEKCDVKEIGNVVDKLLLFSKLN